jgi:hypothetical protein
MTKKMIVLFTLLFLVAMYSSPSWACTVTCGGNTCSGTGDCHCDVVPGGTVPHCTDAKAVTQDYVDYLRTWDLPGLNRMAEAAEDMLTAIQANDLEAYQQREIYSGFEGRPQSRTTPREN